MRTEMTDDLVSDLIGEVESHFQEVRQGPRMAYFVVSDSNGGDHRFIYQTFEREIRLVSGKDMSSELHDLREELVQEIISRKPVQSKDFVLVYRLEPKFVAGEEHCKRCGTHLHIRTRLAIVPAYMLLTGDILPGA